MALSSDLAGAFQIILAQQEAEARKEARQQDISLTLLGMEMNIEQKEMDRQVTLLDRQIARNEKRFDKVYGEFQSTKEEYQKTTGQIYKLPEKDRKDDVIDLLNDVKGGVVDSLKGLLTDIKTETRDYQTAKSDMQRKLGQSKLISDFYKGYGHDMSKGDPERWDAPDFGEEALAEYMAQYPELKDVDQQAFYEGVKTREEAGLFENIQGLNTILHQTQVAELNANIKQMTYDTKAGNITVAQVEADIDNIDSGVHKMIGAHAENLNSSLYAPAIQSVVDFTASKTSSNPTGDTDLEEEQDSRLRSIGSIVTGDPDSAEENLSLGKMLVLSNSNYINSVKGYLKGSADLNYVGYVNGLQEIQFYAERARRALDDNLISTEDYLVYKSGLEELIGTDLNTFNSDMDVLLQASDSVEDKGKQVAIAGMKESYIESEQEIDYNVPDDYGISPTELPGINQLLPVDSSNVTLDSLNLIPESTITVPDSAAITPGEIVSEQPERFDPKYSGWFSKGERYYDPVTDKWYYQEPLLNLAGGFLPVPNPYMFRDRLVPGQRPELEINPIYNDKGELIGFSPPSMEGFAPASTTYTGKNIKLPKLPKPKRRLKLKLGKE